MVLLRKIQYIIRINFSVKRVFQGKCQRSCQILNTKIYYFKIWNALSNKVWTLIIKASIKQIAEQHDMALLFRNEMFMLDVPSKCFKIHYIFELRNTMHEVFFFFFFDFMISIRVFAFRNKKRKKLNTYLIFHIPKIW